MTESVFLIEAEAAAMLRLARGTLQNKRLAGGGPPYIKLGSGRAARVLYEREALIAWVLAQGRTSTSDAGAP